MRLLQKLAVPLLFVLATLAAPLRAQNRFDLVEATVPAIQAALDSRLITSQRLVQMYLARVAAYDDTGPAVNAFLYVNPNAITQAATLDAQRKPGHGPLYGVPVLLKDNIDTADMPTTAGSVALAGSFPRRDSFIARKLHDAGAIIIGKATLTEYANYLTSGMPAGYSSLGGYGLNPYDPRPLPGSDGRPVLTPGGSSSGPGIGVNANLAAVAIGSETSGSILSPASANGVVGIKPTVGLVSRSGVIPITADQDTAGPITRTVTDAAILLGAIAGFDPDDIATKPCLRPGKCFSDYTQFLDRNALNGARIAVIPFPANRADIMNAAIDVLRAKGAFVQMVPALPVQPGSSIVLSYGFKRDFNAYLANTPAAPAHSLAEVIAANNIIPGALKYGQTLAIASEARDLSPGSADTQQYLIDRAADINYSRTPLNDIYYGPDGIQNTADDFDAILASGSSFAGTPAKAGYPSITVPGGFVPPDGTVINPFPSGVTFSGPAFSEPRLIGLAYAYEQATLNRRPPASTPPLPSDVVIGP